MGPYVTLASCFEAGRAGFWLHRLLTDNGVVNRVVEPTSILVTRGASRVKTDRLDAQGLRRVLAAAFAGDRDICHMVRTPSIAEEDDKRPHREREYLVQERVRSENRIAALLSARRTARCVSGPVVEPGPGQPADQRYENAYLFGAISPARGVGAALALPDADPEARQTPRRRNLAMSPKAPTPSCCSTTGNLKAPEPSRTSGSTSDRTGFPTESSRPTTPSSLPRARLGTNSSRNQKPSPQLGSVIEPASISSHDLLI